MTTLLIFFFGDDGFIGSFDYTVGAAIAAEESAESGAAITHDSG